MTVAEAPAEPVETAEPDVVAAADGEPLRRYSYFERVVHWLVALSFIGLLLSGLPLAYPRMWWLTGLFGGGQTTRAVHPWIGVVFSALIVVMVVMWFTPMLFERVDRQWVRRVGMYAREGHTDLDVGRWNAGQKGYFWFALVTMILFLLTGIPLWDTDLGNVGILEWSRLIHHAVFIISVGGFIIHVLLSAMFTETMSSMGRGTVSPAWAAFHHPRWFREKTGRDERPEQQTVEQAPRERAPDHDAAADEPPPDETGPETES